MVSTRSSSKRKHNETNAETDAARPDVKNKKSRRTKKSVPIETVEQPENRCRLLELPPEIRNRIYDFAVEVHPPDVCADKSDSDAGRFGTFAPRARHVGRHFPSWATRPWEFFGLTQTCRQLRSEHRPIWLQSLSVALDIKHIDKFFQHFFRDLEQPLPGPALIQIPWYEKNKGYWDNFLPWLKLSDRFSSTDIDFVSGPLADGQAPRDVSCDYCLELEEAGHYRCCYAGFDDGSCECDDPEMSDRMWINLNERRIAYLAIMRRFLLNRNEAWRKAVREQLVEWSFDGYGAGPVTFRIHCKDAFGQTVSHVQGAMDVLNNWGLFDLPRASSMQFYLVFEEKVTARIGSRSVTNTVLRELRVPLPEDDA